MMTSAPPNIAVRSRRRRRQAIATAEPNPAHFALVELECQKPHFTLVTQNVDGLHERAGSGRVLKLHGDIWRLRCLECRSDWPDRRAPLPKLPRVVR